MDIVIASSDHELRLAVELLASNSVGDAVVGSTSRCGAVVALVGSTRPDTVILDWDLVCKKGVNIVSAVGAEDPAPRVIVLGSCEDDREHALGAGADAFILKGGSPQLLIDALRPAP